MTQAAEVIVLREEKKHSVRYDPQPEVKEPISKGFYINKMLLPIPYPKKIKIMIEWED